MIHPEMFTMIIANTEQEDLSLFFISLFITLFGWFMAYRVRRPLIFRMKLGIVFIIPLILAVSFVCPYLDFTHVYKILLLYMFIFLLSILYWREIRKISTRVGYHRNALVNFLDDIPDMIWMKDLDNKFTYANKATCTKLLHCDQDEIFGRTENQIIGTSSDGSRLIKSLSYLDCLSVDTEKPYRFMKFGSIAGEFIALQVFKAPIFSVRPNGDKFVCGTICMGRDLTYDYLDHERINVLCKAGKITEAIELFDVYRTRYGNLV